MDHQYKQISGRATALDGAAAADLLASSTGAVVRVVTVHVSVTASFSGGAGIVTLRDGTAGTIIAQIVATANNHLDMDFHDGLGYPLTAGNALSLEVSGGTTEGTAIAIATGYLTGV